MKKMMQLLVSGMFGTIVIVGCNGVGGSSSSGPAATAIPANYQCLPSNLPTSVSGALKIAYAANCSVESAVETSNLQALAVAMEKYSESVDEPVIPAGFYNNCTGTPISYNPTTGVTFIVSAAHCVVGTSSQKAAGAPVTGANISTYLESHGHNQAWIYQGTYAGGIESSQLTAQILAVYVPSQYCQSAEFSYDEDSNEYTCPNVDLKNQNGDFAVLKVQAQAGKTVNILPNVKLAPSDLNLTSASTYLLALGYGGTKPNDDNPPNPSNSNLNYINYQFFGTNSYDGVSSGVSIMNGYLQNNLYYSIICGGDSGGGDFAWDGSNWNLVGVHSWGPTQCGTYAGQYAYAFDASADVRQFNGWINGVLMQDTQTTGCANLGSAYACASGVGK